VLFVKTVGAQAPIGFLSPQHPNATGALRMGHYAWGLTPRGRQWVPCAHDVSPGGETGPTGRSPWDEPWCGPVESRRLAGPDPHGGYGRSAACLPWHRSQGRPRPRPPSGPKSQSGPHRSLSQPLTTLPIAGRLRGLSPAESSGYTCETPLGALEPSRPRRC
jgi:hypothetical protein